MTFYVPDELMSQTGIEDKIGIVGQAKVILTKELHNYLLKDLREKVIGPKLLECLNDDRYKALAEKYEKEQEEKKKEEEEKLAKRKAKDEASDRAKQGQNLLVGISPVKVHHESAKVPMSSFRRKPSKALQELNKHKPGYKNKLNIVPMSRALNFSNEHSEEEGEEEDEDEDESDSESESSDEEKEESDADHTSSIKKRLLDAAAAEEDEDEQKAQKCFSTYDT
ncbi:unnamed protein product [Ambrosiozyma monospora]|uniref:Unnamed protein product n=1 Tax=Ambrosiozyma monospora TaxID=43982 RepID=A0ACB5U4C7_AMBMO|nr:unnamed protein product [Ambrosiozyma monospora]